MRMILSAFSILDIFLRGKTTLLCLYCRALAPAVLWRGLLSFLLLLYWWLCVSGQTLNALTAVTDFKISRLKKENLVTVMPERPSWRKSLILWCSFLYTTGWKVINSFIFLWDWLEKERTLSQIHILAFSFSAFEERNFLESAVFCRK